MTGSTKLFIATAITMLGLTSFASAADLPGQPYTKAPAVTSAVIDWTGYYVGGTLVGAWNDSHDTVSSNWLLHQSGSPLWRAALYQPFSDGRVQFERRRLRRW